MVHPRDAELLLRCPTAKEFCGDSDEDLAGDHPPDSFYRNKSKHQSVRQLLVEKYKARFPDTLRDYPTPRSRSKTANVSWASVHKLPMITGLQPTSVGSREGCVLTKE